MGGDDLTLAGELAAIARLGDDDDVSAVLERVVRSVINAVPNCDHATITTLRGGTVETAAGDTVPLLCYRDPPLDHDAGPTVDVLKCREPRRIDDVTYERRWASFRIRMRCAGYASCLSLPLSTRRAPPAALTLYSRKPDAFRDTTHDIAMLLAVQASASMDNVRLYTDCRKLIDQLHLALASRTVIAQAQGLVMAQYRCTADDAITLLKTASQDTNRKLRVIAEELAGAQHDAAAAMRRLGLPAPAPRSSDRRPTG